MIDNTVESSLFVRDQPLPTNYNIPTNVLRSICLIFIKIIPAITLPLKLRPFEPGKF